MQDVRVRGLQVLVEGCSRRQVARESGGSRNTVKRYQEAAGLIGRERGRLSRIATFEIRSVLWFRRIQLIALSLTFWQRLRPSDRLRIQLNTVIVTTPCQSKSECHLSKRTNRTNAFSR